MSYLISQGLELQLDLGSICQIRKLLQYEGLSENIACRKEEKITLRAPTEAVITSSLLKGPTLFTHGINSDSEITRRNVETRKIKARHAN